MIGIPVGDYIMLIPEGMAANPPKLPYKITMISQPDTATVRSTVAHYVLTNKGYCEVSYIDPVVNETELQNNQNEQSDYRRRLAEMAHYEQGLY